MIVYNASKKLFFVQWYEHFSETHFTVDEKNLEPGSVRPLWLKSDDSAYHLSSRKEYKLTTDESVKAVAHIAGRNLEYPC